MRWRSVWLCFLALSAASVTEVRARLVRNHVSSVCSTWGREHFKTFDGDVFQFPGMCEYNLVSECLESLQGFSVHMKRTEIDGNPTIRYVLVTVNELSFHISKSRVTVNDQDIILPYNKGGVQVENNAVYIKLQSKVGFTVMWNGEDAVMVEVDNDFANRTCGLCGDFNGVPVFDEFILNGRQISPIEFGNKHKAHRPNDECEDPYEEGDESLEDVDAPKPCKEFETVCRELFHSESWSSCTTLFDPEVYIQACVKDMCSCNKIPTDLCVCSTLSEFSRQCSHAGGEPPNWRKPEFCAKQCPYNMVFEESGSPCLDTCTHQDTSSMCEEHKIDGCFCPPGTVFDDISMKGCIPHSECQCKHDKIYNSGEVYRLDGEECACFDGKWDCVSLETPATCAVEAGSHFTTFDGKTFTFHGDCYYTLAKVESKDDKSPKFTILAQLVPCAHQKFDTCLKTLKILLNNDRNNVLTFTADGLVKQNMQTISLPYYSGDINIFSPSSFHIMLQTSFGLQIQIQHIPLMQVYIDLEKSYQAKTRGLCGNFNMVLSDEMRTPQGIVEGTAVTFSNSWKANLMCSDSTERLDDPCSLSVENELYAKHWCALLLSPNSTFAQCRSAVDPDIFYKRCTYSSCNCEKSEACLCSVFSSYARACAAKGVILQDWREDVCEKYTKSCPASQTFSYTHQRCQLTCISLSTEQQSCTSDFVPVDGCSCDEGLYLNEQDTCVPMEKCSCYHHGVYIKPGKSINIRDEHCVCTNGKLHCHSWRTRSSECPSPKVFFNCSSTESGDLELQCAQTCLNMDSDCESTECESGCRCPAGLLDDGKGSCVTEEDCPCQHDGHLFAPKATIPNQCNTCTCKSGKWECTEKKCPGTCVIYGTGHYNTFDQRTYGFQGDCAYVAARNKCGNKTVEDNFGVITENVPCGSTGTTCSKTVRIQLGRTEIKLSKGNYVEEDLEVGPQIKYRIRRVGLYLVIESKIGVAVMWDRKTTVRILLEPQHSGEVCGLCGNFDGDGRNDFTTQGQLVVNNPLEFANSWKVSSTCPDVEESVDACEVAPQRHHWAKIMCSIITGTTFKDCHHKVDPQPFYENCVKDSCACDTGGDCECFCSSVAAYAQACNEAGVCVAWRTPDICPVFCDYYNNPDDCKWHYNPCHTPCYKTCLYPDGICSNPIPNLEGCYPVCPEDKPIFDEKNQTCVDICPYCIYNGTIYDEYEVIYNVSDNLGMCYYAICINSTVVHGSEPCPTNPPPPISTSTLSPVTTTQQPTTTTKATSTPMRPTTPTTQTLEPTTTTKATPTPTTSPIPSVTTPCVPTCEWSDWYNVHDPKTDKNDWETYENITNSGLNICENPTEIDCRSADIPDQDFDDFLEENKQVVTCDVEVGLICKKEDQPKRPGKCFDYKIRVCCPVPCGTTTPATTPPPKTTPEPTTTTKATPPPSTTTPEPTTTTKATPPPSTTTPEPTTTEATTTPSPPSTTTPKPTTTTKATPPPSTTTPEPTIPTEATTTPSPLSTTTPEPTTTTKATPPPSTTPEPTTTTEATTTASPPSTTTPKPTTTTKATPPPSTTTPEPTIPTEATTTPSPPSTTTPEPTTTTKAKPPPSTTPEPTTTTEATTTPSPPFTTTPEPTTTTKATPPPSTTTPEPTIPTEATTTPSPTSTTPEPTTTTKATPPPSTTTEATTTPSPPSTTTPKPTTTTTKATPPPSTTTPEPTIQTEATTTPSPPSTTTPEPTTTTKATPPPPTTTPEPTTTTEATTTPSPPSTTTPEPTISTEATTTSSPPSTPTTKLTTTTKATPPPSTTTPEPTTTTEATTTPSPPSTTTPKPTTTTKATPPPSTTTPEPTIPTEATTTPSPPSTTTPEPTTTTKATPPPFTTTPEPTITTEATTMSSPPATTPELSTTTKLVTGPPQSTPQISTVPQISKTTTKPTTTTEATTTPSPPSTTTPKPTTTTKATPPPSTTTPEPTTTTEATTTPSPPSTTTPKPTTTTKATTPPFTETPEPTTTTKATPTPTTSPIPSVTTPCVPTCEWSDWYNVHDPKTDKNDWETYENITNSGLNICDNPTEIDCRSADVPDQDFDDFLEENKQVVTCDVEVGLICKKEDQPKRPGKCFDYKIRVCCPVPCGTTTPATTPPPKTTPEPTTTTKATPPPSTTTPEPTTTTKATPPPTTTTPEPTTTEATTTPSPPSTTTPKPTTTTKATPPPSTTTPEPTIPTEATTTPSPPSTTTPEPTTTTKATPPPSTTPEPTTTTEATTTPSPPFTTTPEPTTTTKATPPPSTTTPEPTIPTEATTTPSPTSTTTPEPTTTTKATPPPSTTTPEPTITTEAPTTPSPPSTPTPEPTTTTKATPPPSTTTEEPTIQTEATTTPSPPATTTPKPTTTTKATPPPSTTTPEPTTTTEATTTPRPTSTTTPEPTTTTKATPPPSTTTPEPTIQTEATTTPSPPSTTTPKPTTTTKATPPPSTTTPEPTTTTEATTLPSPPSTTTPEPTTTTKSTPPPSTTTPEPTITTEAPTTPSPPSTPTPEPTTTTKATPPPSTTTPEATIQTEATTTPSPPSTTTPKPTTTTKATPPPSTTTPEPTTTTEATTTPSPPSTTTPEPTTTTKSTPPPSTTTPEPTITTEAPTTPSPPSTPTPEPTTTTKATPPPSTTTPEPTIQTEATTTPSPPSTTTPKPTTTTKATPPPSTTTPEPTTTTEATTTPRLPSTTTPEPTTTTKSTPPPSTTTPEPTITTEAPTTPSPPSTPTLEPTTTTKATPPPSTTTPEPTIQTEATTTPSPPSTTTPKPTTTTKATPPPSTTTPEPTTTTEATTTPSPPSTTTPEPTTTTKATPPPSTTTPEPTKTTEATTMSSPPATTPELSTTTKLVTGPPQSTPQISTVPQISKTTTKPTPGSTTPCFCVVNGKHYRPGEIIFDKHHIGSGICLTMICSDICEIRNETDICTTTPPVPSPTPYVPECPEWDVVQNETFFLCNCTLARCIENNTIEIIPYECPPLQNITCLNGQQPVIVYDEYYCCHHYACDCECEGWGDPHYITFDGLYYSYQGNCTYVLMEEITPKHHLKIYIDNVFCDPTEDVSCPRSIIIAYGMQVITLINHNLIGAPKLEALKNGKNLKLPYTQQGIKVISSGINLVFEIPQINVVITFGMTGFSVFLPYQNFGKNTQGHCGTCNNNQADDCKLPTGQLVESCSVMADYWPADDIYQPNCPTPPVVPTNKPEPPLEPTPCNPDSICDLLKSSVFAECHPLVSPDNFYRGCAFDSCHVSNPVVECTSLQTYAAACAQVGACIHWRNHTKLCDGECPSGKVYKPCGPAEQPTCEDNLNEPTLNVTTEGCFCPEGMKLFNKESGICVEKCGCLDPEGIPREFNERFEYKCQDCICDEPTKTVICKPKACPPPPIANCSIPGFVLANQTDPDDACCFAFVCQCQINTCPGNNMNCPVGYRPVVSVPEGKCCPEHTCEPKRVCVHKNVEYQPGALVPAFECQDCTCSNVVDTNTGLFKITCQFRPCEETCDMGYEYVETSLDECCGKCVQRQCVLNINGTKQLLNEGETWSPPENKCEHYTCVKSGEALSAVSSQIICPPFQESNCHPNTIQTAANGCCKVCVEKEKACKLVTMKTRIKHQGCQSEQEVDMPYCEGSCNTFSKYSQAAAAMQQSCSCCKETHSSNRTVALMCLNGDKVPYTYMHVEGCSCSHTACPAPAVHPARRKRSFTLL